MHAGYVPLVCNNNKYDSYQTQLLIRSTENVQTKQKMMTIEVLADVAYCQ